jgi:long-chain acyl-CoA synthetase
MSDMYPWHAEYEAFGIAPSLEPYPDHPVHQFMLDAAADHPEQGVFQNNRHYPYEQLRADVAALAAALQARGVEKGNRVATVLPTSIQFLVATHAISLAGGVHVPNDFLDSKSDLVYRLEQSDPDVLIGHEAHVDLLERLRAAAGIDHLILTSLADYGDGESADPTTTVEDAEWLPEVIAGAGEPEPVDIAPEDTHTILFTGGTTGRPKGCLLSHRNLVANATQAIAMHSRFADLIRGDGTVVLALPAYHAYGYTISNLVVALGLDVLVVPDARDTELMSDLIEAHDPIAMFGVPTQFMEVVDEDLDNDVIGLSGSAPLASETKSEFEEEATGLSQGYGLSEMSPITHFDLRGIQEMLTSSDEDRGYDQPTIGVPVPDTEVKLLDVDTSERIPIDEAVESERQGEMYLKGPQRMTGYLDADDPFDEEGFVATGDVVKVDEDGRFYVVDRVKNMINVSGLKVYAKEVEEALFGMDGIRRPATVGVPDPDRPGSEQVKVYVQPEPDADLTAAGVREHLEERVPRQAVPDDVEFVEEIPLTDVGKIDRKALDEER